MAFNTRQSGTQMPLGASIPSCKDHDLRRGAEERSHRRAVIDSPINGESFVAYVEQELVPTLKSDDIVVLDNLGSHKSKAVRSAVRAAGARLVFLPKYSPDLNPIEQAFAKLKGETRKAKPRTVDAICDAIRDILTRFSPTECKNYLVNAGYAPS